MDRLEKQQFVDKLKTMLSDSKLVVLVKYTGLTVSDASRLRSRMREEGASYIVSKNTLARRAFSETSFEPLQDYFKGQTGIAFSDSPVAAAKIAAQFVKDFDGRFEIVAGCMDGKLLSLDEVKVLASLPSMDELRSKLVGVICAPAQKIATVLQAPAGQLARVLGAYSSK